MCVRIFGPKNASNSKHFAKITSDCHLFVQLGWLSQIGRSFEIRHFENSCSSFRCSRDNFRCMNFNKAFIGQRVPKQLANSRFYPEMKKGLIRKCILFTIKQKYWNIQLVRQQLVGPRLAGAFLLLGFQQFKKVKIWHEIWQLFWKSQLFLLNISTDYIPQSTLNLDSLMHFVLYLDKKCLQFFLSHNCDLHDLSDLREKNILNCQKSANLYFSEIKQPK